MPKSSPKLPTLQFYCMRILLYNQLKSYFWYLRYSSNRFYTMKCKCHHVILCSEILTKDLLAKSRFQHLQKAQPQASIQNQVYTTSNTNSDSGTEPEVEMETVSIKKTFKATSAWYRELQAKGMGWEHVSVFSRWEQVGAYLGIS